MTATTPATLVHFSIPVQNLEGALKFYGALLNWKFRKITPTYWMIEGTQGALSLEPERVSGTTPILYFGVQDLDASLARAIELGARVQLPRTDAGDGQSFFATLIAPDGNTIGLSSRS